MSNPIISKFLQESKVGQKMPSFDARNAKPLEDGSLFDEDMDMTLELYDNNNDEVFDSEKITIKKGNIENKYYDYNRDGIIDEFVEIQNDEETDELISRYYENNSGIKELTTKEQTENGSVEDRYFLQDGTQSHITIYEYDEGKTLYDIDGDGKPDTDDLDKAYDLLGIFGSELAASTPSDDSES